jgi:hypothetical protein
MATVIDSLVLELGLDSRNFTKEQRDALVALRKFEDQSVRAGKQIESQGKKTTEFFSSLKREALVALGLFMGGKGIKDFVNYVTQLDAGIGRTSRTIRLSVAELAAWQGAAEQAGGSAQTITGAIGGLQGAMEAFLAGAGGGEGFLPILNRFGVSFRNMNGEVRQAGDVILDLVEAMRKEGVEVPRIAALLRTLPGMNEESVNLFVRGRKAVDDLREAARKAGGATKESADQAEKYQEELAKLDRAATNVGRTMFNWVAPSLTAVLNKFGELFTSWNKSKDELESLGSLHERLNKRFGRSPLSGMHDENKKFSRAPASIPIKPGAGGASPATQRVMDALAGMSGIDRITALNDAYHRFLGGQHPAGNALDLTVKDPSQAAAITEAIRAKLAEAGIAANVRDEYNNPSKNSTGGHIHVGIGAPAAARGVGAAGAAVLSSSVTNRAGDRNTSSSLTIGTLSIHAEGGDADSIARSIEPALRRSGLANHANSGQQ